LSSASVPLSEITGVVAFLVVGALFSAADAAVSSLPEARLRAMLDAVHPGERRALRRVLEDPTSVLARLLVGRIVCHVSASVLAAEYAIGRWPRFGWIVAAVFVIAVYGFLTEVLGVIMRRRATEIAEPVLRIVRPFEIAVMPLAAPLAAVGRLVASLDRSRLPPSDPLESTRIAEAEVEYLIEKGQETGALPHGELLQAAVDFRGTVASEVMVPRTFMVAVSIDTPLARVLDVVSAEGHSRYPIYEGKIDEVVGLLYVKDLFRVVREGTVEATRLRDLVRRPLLYVQENQEVSAILKDMRQQRLHMAIVLDEYGGTAGLVTLEDILELLVGDIRDELDDEDPIQDLGGGRLLVDAALPVDELEERLAVKFPERNGFVSLGGFVMEHLGKVPEPGTRVMVGAVELVVREADERRIRRIEVLTAASKRDARDTGGERDVREA
jgi:CBS domain containing-hemolysin-like protein